MSEIVGGVPCQQDLPIAEPRGRAASRSPISDGVAFLVGRARDWDPERDVRVREAFDRRVLEFLDALARHILTDREARLFPDVIAFAFWCRKAALNAMRSTFADGRISLGRGLGFHIAPSNVPIMVAYNLAMGLLAGNATIVRVPSRAFPEIEYLCRQLETLLNRDAHAALRCCMACIRYDRARADITRYLSARCDVRVLWGGDQTVNELRQVPLQPHAHELTFPDRFSIAVIESEAWLSAGDKARLARGFYNDTYLNDQASCSAPRMMLWLGNRVARARADFWARVEALVDERYRTSPVQTLHKLEYVYRILASAPGCSLCSSDPRVMRVWSETPRPDLLDQHPHGGVFVESEVQGLEALLPVLKRRCQTVAYHGVAAKDIVGLLCSAGTLGGDRVVPLGQTLDFSSTWDGHDIIRALSRTLGVVAVSGGRTGA